MENASKAIIIIASMLLGIMIISVATVLFQSFSGSGASIIKKIEQTKISEFNNRFYKYEAQEGGISVYDVITMTNFAKENNTNLDLNQNDFGKTTNYIKINFLNYSIENYSEKKLIELLENYSERYYISKIDLNDQGRVNFVEIKQIK